MSIEPAQGLRANLLLAYRSKPVSKDKFYNAKQAEHRQVAFRRLIYGLCFFHGVVLERHRYGPAGWNANYKFNMSDLTISLCQLEELFLQVKKYITEFPGALNVPSDFTIFLGHKIF